MSRSNRDRLNTYFRGELDTLRTAGSEFAQAYPSVASELSLAAGVARDPHVEHLVQSFAWMMSRLRMQMENEAGKIPSMLLEELAPSLVEARPSMAIAECDVDGAGTDFSSGFTLKAGQALAPIGLGAAAQQAGRLQRCKFSTPFPVQLWPFTVVNVLRNSVKEATDIARYYPRSKSSLTLTMQADSSASLDSLRFDAPVRFYINADTKHAHSVYDLLAASVIGVAISNADGEVVKVLDRASFKLCGFDDDERMFGLSSSGELGTSVLEDFFAFPDKFQFFEVLGLQDLDLSSFKRGPTAQINVHLILDDLLPKSIPMNNDAFKLNCFPVINLFEKTTEPVALHEKSYRYRLVADRSAGRDIEIQKIDEVFAVDKNGVQRLVRPYFSVQDPTMVGDGLYWVSQREESNIRKTPGNEIWISVFGNTTEDLSGLSLYAKTQCSNRQLAEQFSSGSQLGIVGTAPVRGCELLTRPTRYCSAELNETSLWKLMAGLTRHHSALSMPDSAKGALLQTLSLCAPGDSDTAQRLLDSIDNFSAQEDYVPSRQGGWRGYQHGTKYTMTVNDRLFQGSAMLFGRVILHFLSLFSQMNSFSSLDFYLGDRRVHQWPPMTGHKALA